MWGYSRVGCILSIRWEDFKVRKSFHLLANLSVHLLTSGHLFQFLYLYMFLLVCLFICLSVRLSFWSSLRLSSHPSLSPSVDITRCQSIQADSPRISVNMVDIKVQPSRPGSTRHRCRCRCNRGSWSINRLSMQSARCTIVIGLVRWYRITMD